MLSDTVERDTYPLVYSCLLYKVVADWVVFFTQTSNLS